MIHLRLRTEFSFRRAYGTSESILARLNAVGSGPAAGIGDRGTWGHVHWFKALRKIDWKPILGTEIMVVEKPRERERQYGPVMAFLARNPEGLRELHELVTVSNLEGFYYVPRIGYEDVNRLSSNVLVLSGSGADLGRLGNRGNVWLEMNPMSVPWNRKVARAKGWRKVLCANNYYPAPGDRETYEVLTSRNRRDRVSMMHIPTIDELRLAVPQATDAEIEETYAIADLVDLSELPKAKMVSREWDKSLRQWCEEGIRARGFEEWPEEYQSRLDRELSLIEEKGFIDYFQVIGEMIREAKKTMMVGPARGSAAGSLVCYLMGITDVDPIVHGLMFERFIDVTRTDFPDVDIDFPDRKRDAVIEQLSKAWGEEHVGRIGTVSRYKPKSALGDVARELDVPPWEIDAVKDTITERSSGDERAAFGVADALGDTDLGRELLEKYPGMAIAGTVEGHARHTGMHAAGVLVTERPLTTFASLDRSGAYQLDKKDAEALEMLKIDCLGLRTLSVLEDTLEQIGKDPSWLVNYPLDDAEAFEVLNEERYAGIFQFEGYALQALCRQMKIREFSDIAAITALARPGPLHCGAADDYVRCRIGEREPESLHPLLEHVTEDTFGSVIYQEQVMVVTREMGKFSWEDVTMIRRIMSKSFGDEFFARYWEKFREGAASQGVPEKEAQEVWDKICTFGSWAFNKSHAVSYGLISYWCAVLKAHYPLEFGAACLRNAKDDDQAVKILRELVEEGYDYTPVDPERSGLTWEVIDGRLVGGLTNIKGIGPSKAAEIVQRRSEGRPMTMGLTKLLRAPETPFDRVFETRDRFGDIYENPKAYRILSGGVSYVQDIQEAGEYVFIARLRERKLRDENEAYSVARRGGRRINGRTRFLNLVLEDDTGTIIGKITRHRYPKLGKPIVEEMATGDYLLWKGFVREGWRIVYITQWRYLEEKG